MKPYRVDERALGAGAALMSFFVLVKLSLIAWSMLYSANRPLTDLPPDGWLYLAGADLFFCFAVTVAFAALYWTDNRLAARRAPRFGRGVRALMIAGIVVFSDASFEVARIYNGPLDIELFRDAGDLKVFRRSMWAYVGALPVMLLIYGLVIVPMLGRSFATRLERRTWLTNRFMLWGVVGFVCVGLCGAQYVRLHRVETFGVKENAVIHFVRHYKPPFRPIDTRTAMAALEQRFGAAPLSRGTMPTSLANPGRTIERDFQRPAESAQDFNIILIQMESTGALHVNRENTPNIMALADRGLSFRRHTTAVTQTCPATYSIYYSDYLPELGTFPSLLYGQPMPQPSLGDAFQRGGYRTAVFHTGFLDYMQIRYLFQDKGVEHLIGAKEMAKAGAPLAYSAGVHEERVVDEMAAWIRAQNGQKFFAAYLTEFPHHPYLTMAEKPPFPDDTWLNRYKNSLHYADSAVGRLIDVLKAEGLLDKTIIAVVGDHGETVSHYPVGHGLRVTIEEMRTPFVVSNPKLFPSGVESKINSDHLDIAPTLTRLVGVDAPSEWLGRDMFADRITDRMQFVTITQVRRTGVIDGDLLYVLDRNNGKSSMFEMGATELIALPDADPRAAAMASYHAEADLFNGWASWRHLARADALRSNGRDGGGAVATGNLQTVATPAADAVPATPDAHRHD